MTNFIHPSGWTFPALETQPFLGCMFFEPGHPFFGPVHVFGFARIVFFGPGGTKNVGGLACVFSGPCGDICFFDLHVFVLDPGKFFRQPN